MWQLVRTVVVPYLVFESLLALFRVYVGGEQLKDLFQDPHWPMWYLSALFFWRLLTPIFRPMWGGVVVAVGISLVAGLYAGDTLDMARVLGLLPFFVMGLKATPSGSSCCAYARRQVAAAVVLVGDLGAVTTWTDAWASTEWLYYRSRYDEMGYADDLHALADPGARARGRHARCARRSSPWCRAWAAGSPGWARATLVVYLFHGFVVKGADYAGYVGLGRRPRRASRSVVTTRRRGRCWRCCWPGRRWPVAAQRAGRPARRTPSGTSVTPST